MSEKTLLISAKTGACDHVQIFYYPAYAPGYAVEITKPDTIGKPVATFWFHELSDAEALYSALQECADSTIEERGYTLKIQPFGG
jgi:hypothetical protein